MGEKAAVKRKSITFDDRTEKKTPEGPTNAQKKFVKTPARAMGIKGVYQPPQGNTVVELALKRVRNSIQIVVEGLHQEGHEEEEEYTKERNRSLYYIVANKTFLIALCYKINVFLGFFKKKKKKKKKKS